jgi:hypothetical protein
MTSPIHSRLVWCWATALAGLACGGQTESSSQRSSGSGGALAGASGGGGFSQGGSNGGVTALGGSPAGAAAAGGFPSGGASLGGTAAGGVSTGGSSLGGVATGGSSVGGYGQDGSVEPDAWNPWPACTARGGACVFMDLDQSCPQGTYNPFSDTTLCPTGSYSRCCVPTGRLGSPCDASNPCTQGGCLSETANYPPGGVCDFACGGDNCPAWGVCVPVFWSEAPSVCLVACTSSSLCREGQSCQAFAKTWGGGETTYACWRPGSPDGKGLGDLCDSDGYCLSLLCRPDPTQTNRCSATCDDAHRCLTGFACVPEAGCSTPGCGLCFPT